MRPSVLNRNKSAAQFIAACRGLIDDHDVTNWWPASDAFEVMVGAILVQNTRWTNVAKAIDALQLAGGLDPVILAQQSLQQIEKTIRPSGCQSVKAERLRSMSRWLTSHDGIEAIRAWPTRRLRAELLSVKGIGDETADAMLCFAFSRPVFIADQYARRWLVRMGFWQGAEARHYSPCRVWVERQLAGSGLSMQSLHAAIVLHGQQICRRVPDCANCPLQSSCQTGLNAAGRDQ